MWAIQLLENFGQDGKHDAKQALKALEQQTGYLGGRLLPHSAIKPGWWVQAFFQDEGPEAADWLPDGMRRVWVPKCLQNELF